MRELLNTTSVSSSPASTYGANITAPNALKNPAAQYGRPRSALESADA